MARTYRINGTLALKPARGHVAQGTVIALPARVEGSAYREEDLYLFDADLSVTQILDNAGGFKVFESARDRISAALVGASAVTIFFFLSFITSI